MERTTQLISEANRLFNTADHLAYITYPLVKETKLMVTITENLYLSLMAAVDALLQHEKAYKRISLTPNDFESKLDTFRRECMPRYKLDRSYLLLIKDIHDIIEHKKKSPIEFIRNDKYIMCSDSYKMKVLTIEGLKQYIAQSKEFIFRINKVLLKNGRQG